MTPVSGVFVFFGMKPKWLYSIMGIVNKYIIEVFIHGKISDQKNQYRY